MVSLLIGTLLIAGALTVFMHSRLAWQSVENLAGLEERLAYALTEIEQDVRIAGNWGLHASGTLIAEPAGVSVHCGGNDVTAWALNLATAVAATDGLFGLPCPAYSGHVNGSDTLTLRFAQPGSAEIDSDYVQLATDTSGGHLLAFGMADQETLPEILLFNLAVRGWYLDTSSSEPGLAALRRYTLTKNGLLQNQEIIPGIEDFQILLGVDRDADGLIDGFVDPGKADSEAAIVAVRIWLLARTAAPEPGHVDNGPWQSIDNDTTAPLRPLDGYRRLTAQRTVWLRNQPEP